MRNLTIMLLILCLGAVVGPGWADERPTVRIGVIAPRDIDGAEYSWGATLSQLSVSLPDYRFEMRVLDQGDYRRVLADRGVDFIIGNPAQYIELETEFGVSRIATVEFAGGPAPSSAIGSLVFTRAGRTDITSFANLRGKRLVAIAPDLFGGFRVAWKEFAEQGFDPFTDASSMQFVGEPVEKVFAAVRDGRADVGIARGCYLERLVAAGRLRGDDFAAIEGRTPERLRCQVSTPLYPDWPFAKLASTPDSLAKRVAQALLAMPAGENGLSWTVPVDYQPVHAVFRALKIGPYEYLRQRSLYQLARENWHWVVVVVLCLAWALISLARVQYLVRLRTQQLYAAHLQTRREREKMEHAARLSLMGEMASSIAHEISQPLAAIVNYARGCQRRLADGHKLAEIEGGMAQIVAQAERAAIIVRRMRDFVRKRPPSPSLLNIGEILEETLDFFLPLAERQGVKLDYACEMPLPRVSADRIQIEEVLLNLLQNAVDAVKDTDERLVRLSAAVVDDVLMVSVQDTGPGMSQETCEHLFEAFYTTKPEGLGLGLSLCRSIVEAHGGRLTGENLPEGGTMLSFSLPIAQE